MLKHQYYYRNDACTAANAYSDDCICWYDEGTGPFPLARPDVLMQAPTTWRTVLKGATSNLSTGNTK
jgi:hypothetical protein